MASALAGELISFEDLRERGNAIRGIIGGTP
jgi:hypothetical protein